MDTLRLVMLPLAAFLLGLALLLPTVGRFLAVAGTVLSGVALVLAVAE